VVDGVSEADVRQWTIDNLKNSNVKIQMSKLQSKNQN
jgi:hypothetical protein